MHGHILTGEMCRLMQGVSRAHAPVIEEGGDPSLARASPGAVRDEVP